MGDDQAAVEQIAITALSDVETEISNSLMLSQENWKEFITRWSAEMANQF
jgi:hypothetical protein